MLLLGSATKSRYSIGPKPYDSDVENGSPWASNMAGQRLGDVVHMKFKGLGFKP